MVRAVNEIGPGEWSPACNQGLETNALPPMPVATVELAEATSTSLTHRASVPAAHIRGPDSQCNPQCWWWVVVVVTVKLSHV